MEYRLCFHQYSSPIHLYDPYIFRCIMESPQLDSFSMEKFPLSFLLCRTDFPCLKNIFPFDPGTSCFVVDQLEDP